MKAQRGYLDFAWIVLPMLGGASLSSVLLAAGGSATAPAPKFDPAVLEAFVPDARKLVGPGKPGPAIATPAAAGAGAGTPVAATPSGGGGLWPSIISAESLESEIKFQQKIVADSAKTLNGFKSGGNVKARDSLLMMAGMFAIISKYDGEVKWKKDAEGMQQLCTQAGNNCKTSSDNAYKEVQRSLEKFGDLLNGKVNDLPALEPETSWGQHITINPLMKRLEMAEKDHLGAWTSDAGDIAKHKDDLIREGEALAFIGQFICDSTFELAENDDYTEWAQNLVKAGKDLAQGAKDGNLANVQAAATAIKKTCTDCHGAYR